MDSFYLQSLDQLRGAMHSNCAFSSSSVLSFSELKGIKSLQPLEELINIDHKSLIFSGEGALPDFPKLSSNDLKHINFGKTQPKNLQNLSSLPSLTHLKIGNHKALEDIVLPNLESLIVNSKTLQNVDFLYGWEKLSEVALSDYEQCKNIIDDSTSLMPLQSVKRLTLLSRHLTSCKQMSCLHQLEYLNLYFNSITCVDGLQSATQLKTLFMPGTKVKDLSPLYQLPHLEELYLMNTPVKNIRHWKSRSMNKLLMTHSKLQSIEQLGDFENLRSLSLGGTPIQSLSGISRFQNLQELHLDKLNIIDLSPLTELPHLEVIDLNGVKNLDKKQLLNLIDLPNVKAIAIYNTPLQLFEDELANESTRIFGNKTQFAWDGYLKDGEVYMKLYEEKRRKIIERRKKRRQNKK